MSDSSTDAPLKFLLKNAAEKLSPAPTVDTTSALSDGTLQNSPETLSNATAPSPPHVIIKILMFEYLLFYTQIQRIK